MINYLDGVNLSDVQLLLYVSYPKSEFFTYSKGLHLPGMKTFPATFLTALRRSG